MNYFVIMVERIGGREAIVDPEMTRRGAIEFVREILGDNKRITFIHEVNDFGDGHMMVSDVTDEMVSEAKYAILQAAE